jgi:hypothetical protein
VELPAAPSRVATSPGRPTVGAGIPRAGRARPPGTD